MGTLDGEELTQFETHLDSGCPACTSYARRTVGGGGDAGVGGPAVSPRPELREKLLARVRTEQAPETPAPSFST